MRKKEYQITILTLKIEDLDGDDLIKRFTKSTVNWSTHTLPNLLVQNIRIFPNRISLLLHLKALLLLIQQLNQSNKQLIDLQNLQNKSDKHNYEFSINPGKERR